MHSLVLYNGRIIPATEKVLSPGQVGLLAGWGVFTTLRIYDGVPFEFERHWARMSKDARLLHVPLAADPEQVRRQLCELVRANHAENGAARMCVVRNTGSFWEGPGISTAADVIALTSDLKPWGEAVRLGVVPAARYAASPFSGTKILSWAWNLTWSEEAQQRGFDEALLLNERGEVAECTSANVFAVIDGKICTPPLSSGCLPGVTRSVLLEEIGGIEERSLRPEELYDASEVFITSTTRELLAVSEIEGHTISSGPVRGLLQQAFTDYVRQYTSKFCSTAASPIVMQGQ
ncbi:MAG TPA: aminotransferase class IV [Bryobacterales bacterium]|nr:aminotransferase class IV [Bryobacterales bacterium]